MMFSGILSLMRDGIANQRHGRTTTIDRKDRLFEDFYRNMVSTIARLEKLFELTGLDEQMFGCEPQWPRLAHETQSRDALKKSLAWRLLSQTYDYAVEGIDQIDTPGSASDGTSSLIIDAGEVIALLTGEEAGPSGEWHDIIRMADGRFALEDGQSLDIDRLALLANVDVRTVRNAISAGALVAYKHHAELLVANDSARAWLTFRKSYKPTSIASGASQDIAQVQSPSGFAAFLKDRRAAMPDPAPLLDAYPGLTAAMLAEAEAGLFRAPLSAVWPMADYYGISREELLACVMRIFFPNELSALTDQLRGRPILKLAKKEGE
jgi:hypothetical protein